MLCGETKIFCPYWESKYDSSVIRSLATVPTELSLQQEQFVDLHSGVFGILKWIRVVLLSAH
jgi:hypothetical protein